MSFIINRSEIKIDNSKSQDFEVVMSDGSIEKFTLKEKQIREDIIQRFAHNRFVEWRLKTAKEYEETHYGVSIKRYLDGEVIKEFWVRNVDDAKQWVKEQVAYSVGCDVSEISAYNIKYFGFFPRIYISGFGDEDYYQFERGEFREEGYEDA